MERPACRFRGRWTAAAPTTSSRGAVIGSVMVGHDGHRGWLYYLAVLPEAQGQGIGSALFAAAEDWLRAAGIPKVQLMVRGDNHAAIDFHAARGLERQDVVVFGRFLSPANAMT